MWKKITRFLKEFFRKPPPPIVAPDAPVSKIRYKNPEVERRSKRLCPEAKMILEGAADWAFAKGLPFVITSSVSTYGEDMFLRRVSASHREARAFDISIKGWSENDIKQFENNMTIAYRKYAAVSGSTGLPALVVVHDNGNGRHIHVQLHKRYAIGS